MERHISILAQLRYDILSGQLACGTALRQEALARRFNSSRQPIREALRLLAAEGLIRQTYHRGAIVVENYPCRIEELLDMRLLLQCHAIRSGVRIMTNEAITQLESHWRIFETAAGERNDIRQHEQAFQLSLVSCEPNPAIARSLRELIAQTPLHQASLPAFALELLDAIVRSCRARQAVTAERYLRRYLGWVKDSLPQ